MTARATGAVVSALLLAACTGSGQQAAPSSPPPAQAPAATSTPSAPEPTTSPTSNAVALDESCDMATGDRMPAVTLTHPAGWDVAGDGIAPCQFFAPDDPELDPGTEADGVDIRWSVEPVTFSTVAGRNRAREIHRRLSAVVDGHRALRMTATSTGDAALPAGVAVTTWAVDLSLSTRGDDATLVGTTRDVDAVSYEEAVRVLDAMARSVVIGPSSTDAQGETTVARWEGRRGFVVTARQDGCLELYAGDRQGELLDRACELGRPDPLTVTILRGGDLEVAAGMTTTNVDAVRLRANTDAQRSVVPTRTDARHRAFGLPLSGTEAALVAETFAGEEIGEVEVLPE